MASSIFDNFTSKYSLSKTLRFELKPVGKTKELLEKNKVFKKDQTIDDSYNQAKPYFDKLHQDFINDALAPEKVNNIDFVGFAKFVDEQITKLRKLRKELNEARLSGQETTTLQEKIQNIEKATDEEINRVVARCCNSEGGCLKTILWEISPGNPVRSLPAGKFSPPEPWFPLLCNEGCNLLVGAIRAELKKDGE